MAETNHTTGGTSDLGAARAALRDQLQARGYDVASDTLGLRSDLYVIGENDLARALFEFKPTADEAVASMYQGMWMPNMPPRFAVLPAADTNDSSTEMLEQIRVIPLYFEIDETGGIGFPDLDALLHQYLGE